MISADVPSEITSLEDKLFGNFSLKQLFLFMAPVIIIGSLFIGLPPLLTYAPYKLILAIVIGTPIAGLGLRIQKIIVLDWLIILIKYHSRIKRYLAEKNDSSYRLEGRIPKAAQIVKVHTPSTPSTIQSLAFPTAFNIHDSGDITFTSKKGRIHAYHPKTD